MSARSRLLLRRHELVVAGGHEVVGSDRFRRRLPVNRNQRRAYIDGGRQGTSEHDQSGERQAEQQQSFPNAAYDLRVKAEWPLEFSGIAQPGVRLPYRNRIGHASAPFWQHS